VVNARVAAVALVAGLVVVQLGTHAREPPAPPPWQAFLLAAGADRRQADAALDQIAEAWQDPYAALIVDVARFLPSPRRPRPSDDPVGVGFDTGFDEDQPSPTQGRGGFPIAPRQPAGAETRRRLTSFLDKQTPKRFGDDLRAWRRWIWSLPDAPHPDYAAFKADLYSRIDPRFRTFFPAGVATRIRLDEIDWGGVSVNGIPPLRFPATIPAADASWLKEGHIVFGILVNGEARAYPKRILAWHEMALDRVGGVDLTVVYCTLCGTVVPYESVAGGRRFSFGTSGLLYRSNKLMFDEETGSLWSSLEGVPVVGPLADSGLRLAWQPVVTTTWGEWKRDHPSTTVLSLETGFERDYSEGAAYRDYFATDRLMFEVPTSDGRLRNKAEVLVLRPEVLGGNAAPVAIAADRLRREPVYAFDAGGRGFLVVTSKGGANRVYRRGSRTFDRRLADGALRETNGRRWSIADDALVSDAGDRLSRVPAHRAFWFGWVAQYPETVLVK